jgi:hypothetical protein
MAGTLGLMVGLCMQGDPVCITSSSDGWQKSSSQRIWGSGMRQGRRAQDAITALTVFVY